MALSLPGLAQRRVLALIPALLVLVIGALAYDRAKSVVADVEEVNRSHAVIEESDLVLTRAIDAETGQRAYLLTDDTIFLDPYRGAREDINGYLDPLRRLTEREPPQRARLDTIASLIAERFALLDLGITQSRTGAMTAATNHARLLAGKIKMDQLRAALAHLQGQERLLLSERHAVEQRSVRNAAIVIGLVAVLALILSALINLTFSRAVEERESANAKLRAVNADLEQQSEQLETQAVEMESQAAELEATAEDLRSTNEELNATGRAAESARLQLEQVLENLPDAASVFDSEWRWTFINPAARRILTALGIDADRVKGKVLWDELKQVKGTRFETETRRAAREKKVVQYEEYLPDLDAWLENTVVPANDVLMTFTRDITRHKREQEGAELLSEASRVLASTLDYEKTLESVARLAVGDLAEWCAVDLVQAGGAIRQAVVAHVDEQKIKWAKELNKRYPPDYAAPAGVGQVIRTGKPEIYADISDEMVAATARDPQHLEIMRELQIKSALIVPMIARGRTLGALTLISTRKGRRYGESDLALAMEIATRAALAIDNAQLYQSALAASEAKSAFLATMSHELRTPLNAIIGYQSLLKEGIDGTLNQSQLAQLSRIRASADHLLTLIDEILTFSRVEAGKEVMRWDDAELRPLVEEALTMVRPLAEQKGLTLRADVPDGVIRTDGGKLRQILVNLLSNAVKFTESGEITVGVRRGENRIEFYVTDTGIGIAEENLQRIFEPFWQVEQSSTRRAGGTGLGLTVSRSLARMLGGDVRVESTPGEGSTFILTLPAQTPESRGA
ncbi:MAG TPA: CHASE3 domain-containing protein [Gemmatimonadaceae bacterium]|nr:CHASE3 domain-containing protein [Gemmatimonadaceae bacterium]